MSSARTVGFIGLGAIGWPMAERLARAGSLMVWNRTSDTSAAFASEFEVEVAGSVAEMVDAVDTIITCLPESRQVLEVVHQAEGRWRGRHLVVDATSGDPAGARQVADWLGRQGAGFVDAPVSGGTAGARAGTLTVMLGGTEPWIGRATDAVAPFAGMVRHVGPVGAGHALKAVNQGLLAVGIQAAGAGLAALAKLGVDPAVALEVINASTGRSFVTENLFPRRVLTREWPRTFRLALHHKDVRVATEVLEQTGVESSLFSAALAALEEARQALGEEADHVEVVKRIERAAGVEIGSLSR